MAADDIYYVQYHLEGPSQPASFGVYYQETGLSTSPKGATQSLAESANAMRPTLINILSRDWQFTAVTASRKGGFQIAKHVFSTEGVAGVRPANALPANNAMLIQLFQTQFPKTSNGRVYIPGISEQDTSIGRVESTFLGDELLSFSTRLSQAFIEADGTGVWVPGVVSAKVRDAIPGQKNWQDAFSTMVGALAWPVIARQRRRQTRVIGTL